MSAIQLPLPPVTQLNRGGQICFATASLDDRGRIAARALMRELGWAPGMVIGFHLVGAMLVAAPADAGSRIDRRGSLHVPGALRRRCRLSSGDHVLLVVLDGQGVLLVHPPALVEAMVRGQQGGSGERG